MINKEYINFLKNPPGLGGNWSNRYNTFLKAFEMFEKNNGNYIVELGTTRSYVSGHLEGCLKPDDKYWDPLSPEKWDWQAGCFTILAAEYCKNNFQKNINFSTVDFSAEHLRRSKMMTDKIYSKINYINDKSENFLLNCDEKIDFLYIDTGDPNSYTRDLQLREAKIIVEKSTIRDGGIVLIDDVYRPKKNRSISYVNKSELSLPYYLLKGFEIVHSEYQTLLRKK
jgi:hypothetical protein